MQSGISVSNELHTAFTNLWNDKNQRGLLVSIQDERLVPDTVLPCSSPDFSRDLSILEQHITAISARYILLRRSQDDTSDLILITYVPDAAPVREKMLYAATRLSLQRELGVERFKETFFATKPEELTPSGWAAKDLADGAATHPLTEEEIRLQGAKVQAATENRGTSARSSHVSTGLQFPVSQETVDSLDELLVPGGPSLVQLRINMALETVEVASKLQVAAADVSSQLASHEPRFSFYRNSDSSIVFIYTCPSSSKIKEKMLYASSRAGVLGFAEGKAKLKISRKIEASEPGDLQGDFLDEETQPETERKPMFSKPKRPARR